MLALFRLLCLRRAGTYRTAPELRHHGTLPRSRACWRARGSRGLSRSTLVASITRKRRIDSPRLPRWMWSFWPFARLGFGRSYPGQASLSSRRLRRQLVTTWQMASRKALAFLVAISPVHRLSSAECVSVYGEQYLFPTTRTLMSSPLFTLFLERLYSTRSFASSFSRLV